MKRNRDITRDRVLELLRYEPATGKLYWLVNRGGRYRVGKEAGSVHPEGYRHIGIDGKIYAAHQIVWLIENGVLLKMLDHKGTNRDNNRFKNLRPATRSQNNANSRLMATNTVGFKGVSREGRKFKAQITVKGAKKYLGRFDTPEQAHAAYVAAAKKHFGEYARAG